ncbi:YhgE/Pip domain-containing protein [Caloramator sp. ALD01]|uniref:YhgE/Pip domain-containing protein n=1 Tax=Caloramator sp. ALD01 TaxID=1031288 RepID=UPI000425D38B|nr:YhgE/Pip domain-containing protein [Caloramator sp. ALD01]
MRALKIAKKDLKNLFTNRFNRVAVIVVSLMPLLYSFLYLYAFWDPYSKLDKMPVAVVNLDKGSTKDGERVNYGDDIIDELKDNTKIKWEFVDYNRAMDGLNNKGYYSAVIIPEDFSKRITDASEGKIDKAELIYIPNEKKNFLAAQVSSRVMLELKDEIAKSITEEASKVVIDSLYEVKDGLSEAKDGSVELNDGAIKLRDGSKELSDGLKMAKNGIVKLNDGSKQLKDGLGILNNGAEKLNDGSRKLSDGLKTASDGSKNLKDGLTALKGGQTSLVEGLDKVVQGMSVFAPNLLNAKSGIQMLYEGSIKLEAGLNEIVNRVSQFKALIEDGQKDVDKLANGANQVADGAKNLNEQVSALNMGTKLNSAAQGIDEVSNAIDSAKALLDAGKVDEAKLVLSAIQEKNLKQNLSKPLKESAVAVDTLVQATATLKEGTKQVAEGTQRFAEANRSSAQGLTALLNGLNEAKNGALSLKMGLGQVAQLSSNEGVAKLSNGVAELKIGAEKIRDGLNVAESKTGELSEGLNKLYLGSLELNNGTVSLKDGAAKLYDGSSKLNDGLVSLNSGTDRLYDGSLRLNDGLNKLADGTLELKDGLTEGYDKINNKLKFSSEDMSKFMSEPVRLNEQPINHVPDYGTGFAPYFIPLSLWVGALIMFFIVSGEVDDEFKGHPAAIIFGKFITFAFLGILQAVASSFILIHVLNLEVKSLVLFYGFNILLSFVFISVIEALIMIFGDAGRFLSLVLLMLQLTSCAGTFPLELVPNFFVKINPYLPMTYATSALREIISGIDYGVLRGDVVVLIAFMIASIIVSILLKYRLEKISQRLEKIKQSTQVA